MMIYIPSNALRTSNISCQSETIVMVFGANMKGLIMAFIVIIVDVSKVISLETKIIDFYSIMALQIWNKSQKGRFIKVKHAPQMLSSV